MDLVALMNKIQILNGYKFYNEAEPSLKQQLEQAGNIVNLPAGRFFFHEGDACTQVVLIGKGDIRVFKTGESGREITLYHVKPGGICLLTSLGMMTDHDYPASAQVVSSAEVLLFPASKFRKWVTLHKEIRELAFETITDRIVQMMVLIDKIMFQKIDLRLAEFLINRFTNNKHCVPELRLTHGEIASELNSAREVISRALKKLEQQHAIALSRGCIRLLDKTFLKKLAQIQ